MAILVNIPEKITEYIKKPYNRFINEAIVVELYREGLLTLRQAAELLGISLNDMFVVLSERKTYINYGPEELDEDISYSGS
ncbi:MAG: UPF0175 family protein [Nitrospira sp.]|nr:UPF0175 family protein [Nitrospira sp.]